MTLSNIPEPSNIPKPKGPRSMARLWAVKALFQHEQTVRPLSDLLSEMQSFWMTGDVIEHAVYNAVDAVLFETLVRATIELSADIDEQLKPLLPQDWSWDRLDPVMRAILRTGCGEARLMQAPPPGVLINEYVDIAAAFSGPTGAGFANRILDQAFKKISPA